MDMTLDGILNDLKSFDSGKTSKTASAAPQVETSKVQQAREDLLAVVKKAEASSSKTAAAAPATPATPVADITKIAQDLANADHAALVKEAQFYGAAVCDGFMARLGQYEQAAGSIASPVKVASAGGVDQATVEKIASEAVRGYIETRQQMEKQASDAYSQGYNATMQVVTKVASDCFGRGFADAERVVASLR